ncbi:carbohydrate porin [Tropicimonas sediminicola]|uniref:Porin n=1 Tax=Tropicimonas sediminicola TaxID=1031541 RepID=A0A239FSK4_9RHOB|nr:carbohydrate porin [Tropicimonas sediminicola]SNS59775.1 porin [Tropicimonas sediminicola]
MATCRALSMALALALLPGLAAAQQGLSGPSSVAADLEPGDGLTDPQPRSSFPRNALPGYFAWKDRLAESGFRFNLDYLALGQWSDSDLGQGDAGGGLLRFYGAWQATENGSLTFKVENRQAYGEVAPQFFGFDGGALSITGTAFNDNGTMLTNLFWTQRDPEGRWTIQLGQLDVTDFVDVYGLVSPYTAFQNLAFNTNPTINAPNPGLGIAAGAKLGEHVYVVGAVADANGDPTEPTVDVFDTGETFKSIEIGYTAGSDRIYFDNIHLTFWQSDEAEDGSRAEDKGVTFSAAWFIDNTWMPFIRAGRSDGTAALYDRSLSTGLGWYRRNTDLAGIGLNWAQAKGFDDTQFTTEAFYRFNISTDFQITPSIQYVSNPLLNPESDDLTIFGLRARIVF